VLDMVSELQWVLVSQSHRPMAYGDASPTSLGLASYAVATCVTGVIGIGTAILLARHR
jgi:hypothetical protein